MDGLARARALTQPSECNTIRRNCVCVLRVVVMFSTHRTLFILVFGFNFGSTFYLTTAVVAAALTAARSRHQVEVCTRVHTFACACIVTCDVCAFVHEARDAILLNGDLLNV